MGKYTLTMCQYAHANGDFNYYSIHSGSDLAIKPIRDYADFLQNNFPIKFIDKIVTMLPDSREIHTQFFEKVFILRVKKLVVYVSKFSNINLAVKDYYNITDQYNIINGKIVVLELAKQ